MAAVRAVRDEEFVARPGAQCDRCDFHAICPAQVVGVGALVTHTIETPEQLRAVMHADFTFSAQQFEAITAPLEPAVVIAGAGSGKTTVMAARVVWLVATGQVAPAEVLGLTFTTKATAELATRIRESLRAAGLLPARGRAARRTPRRSRSPPSRRTTPTPPGCSPSTACGSGTSPTPA